MLKGLPIAPDTSGIFFTDEITRWFCSVSVTTNSIKSVVLPGGTSSQLRSGMGSTHLLQLLPGGLIGIELHIFTWMNLLPVQAALGITTEDGNVDPHRFIVRDRVL